MYLANGLLMTLLWFLLRICLFGWVGYRLILMRAALFSLPALHSITLGGGYAFGYCLQIFWFRKILKGALKAVGIGGDGKKKAAKQAD